MNENEIDQVLMSVEERQFLNLCLKQKNTLQLKGHLLKVNILDKLALIFKSRN